MAHLVLQVRLHGDVYMSPIVHGDSLKLSERASKRGNRLQLIVRRIDVDFSKVFVSYIKQAVDVTKGFRRKRVSPID